jgi:hypothetical protein
MKEKKHSAKPGARARKRGIAPANPTRRGEIVEDIVERHLRPWKDRKGAAAVSTEVSKALEGHVKFALEQAKVSTRTQIQDHAEKLGLSLMKFENLLRSAPAALIWSLYYPAAPIRTVPQKAEDIDRAIRKRAEDFAAELKRIRQECARAGDTGFDRHPNYDNAKHMCAWGARRQDDVGAVVDVLAGRQARQDADQSSEGHRQGAQDR